MATKRRAKSFKFNDVNAFLLNMYKFDVHAKRIYSMANATVGVMSSGSLAIHTIGQGLAQARGLVTKHAIKQVDRLLSNNGIDVWDMFGYWIPEMVGSRKEIVIAMDWTAAHQCFRSCFANSSWCSRRIART